MFDNNHLAQHRAVIQQRTAENRLAVSATALAYLASHNLTLDAVLAMDRQDFEALNSQLYLAVSQADRAAIIKFKLGSMTQTELDAYEAVSDEEAEALAADDPEYARSLDEAKRRDSSHG